jgi:hypothetical protein
MGTDIDVDLEAIEVELDRWLKMAQSFNDRFVRGHSAEFTLAVRHVEDAQDRLRRARSTNVGPLKDQFGEIVSRM